MYKIHHKWNHDLPKLARASGFKFFDIDTNCQSLDFRKIGQLDVEAIKQDSNFEQLAQLIPHVAEAPIAKLMDSRILDPALVKYFMAAQLIVQYLTFCLQCLDQAVSELHQTICELETEKQATATVIRRQNDELNHLQRKVSRLQTGNRKKPEVEGDVSAKDLNLINTIKLELEVKHLKERLNNAEKELHERRTETLQPAPIVVATPVPSPRRYSCSCSCRTERPPKDVQEVGIQSNLDDVKEQSDDKNEELREMMERLVEAQNELAHKFVMPADDHHNQQPAVLEVEQFTQKIENLETLVTNLSQNLETMKTKANSNEDDAANLLIRTKISEIEKTQEKGQQKLQELNSEYGEKLGDIRTELGKIAQFLAVEKKPPPPPTVQTEMKAIHAMVHAVPSEESVSESATASFSDDEQSLDTPAKSPEPEQPTPHPPDSPIEVTNTKAITENLFQARLKSLGISSKTKSVPTLSFERIQQRLAVGRTKQRKTHVAFMKVRKQLSAEASERANRPKTAAVISQKEKVQQAMAQEVKTPRSMSEESVEMEKPTTSVQQVWRGDTIEEVKGSVVESTKQQKKKVLFVDSAGSENLAVRLQDILDSDDIGSELDFTIPY